MSCQNASYCLPSPLTYCLQGCSSWRLGSQAAAGKTGLGFLPLVAASPPRAMRGASGRRRNKTGVAVSPPLPSLSYGLDSHSLEILSSGLVLTKEYRTRFQLFYFLDTSNSNGAHLLGPSGGRPMR